MKTLLINLFLLVVFSFSASATHIIGCEINYTDLGNNKYAITVKVYRDCSNPMNAPFDNPLYLGIYDSLGNLIEVDSIVLSPTDTLSNNTYSPCLLAPPNVCVQEAFYTDTLTLPPITGGYNIIWQRCCRNASVININDPLNTGASYISHIPGSYISVNSDPYFKNFPPTVICADNPFAFDHSAIDPDGDSLVYSLYAPFNGANTVTTEPNPPLPPPYDPVIYVAPYTSQNPMGGSTPLSIDRKTGLMTGTFNTLGRFVVGVSVIEYRNGVFLSNHRRDFQFNVTTCSSVVASFTNADTISTATFNSSASIGAVSYNWDFGDGSTDTTANPVHYYAEYGVYTVCLTITSASGCSSKVCRNIAIGVPNTCSANFALYPDSVTPHYWYAINKSYGVAPVKYLWSWGDGSTDTSATPTHTYSSQGFYTICLTVRDDSTCTSSVCDSNAYLYRSDGSNTMVYVNVMYSLPNGIENMHVYPNPCYNCEVSGVDNINDVMITDVLGRRMTPSFTKIGSNSYIINLWNGNNGLFFLKDIKTGEVIKFVKE